MSFIVQGKTEDYNIVKHENLFDDENLHSIKEEPEIIYSSLPKVELSLDGGNLDSPQCQNSTNLSNALMHRLQVKNEFLQPCESDQILPNFIEVVGNESTGEASSKCNIKNECPPILDLVPKIIKYELTETSDKFKTLHDKTENFSNSSVTHVTLEPIITFQLPPLNTNPLKAVPLATTTVDSFTETNRCDLCLKTFANKRNLKRHMLTHDLQPGRFKCTMCSKTFIDVESLKRHLVVLDPQKCFKCFLCPKVFAHNVSLKEHLLTHHRHSQPSCFKCTLCPEVFALKVSLKQHLLTHYRHSQPSYFKCTLCPKAFALKVSLKQHLLTHYRHSQPSCSKCTLCPKVFALEVSLKQHLLTHLRHLQPSSFKCTLCPKVFLHNVSLKKHMLNHDHNAQPSSFKCTLCPKTFSGNRELKQHFATHYPELRRSIHPFLH